MAIRAGLLWLAADGPRQRQRRRHDRHRALRHLKRRRDRSDIGLSESYSLHVQKGIPNDKVREKIHSATKEK